MGRRPTVKKDQGALPARDPRVQKKIDDLTCDVLDSIHEKLKEKLAAGDLNDTSFKDLMKHFNDMVKATKLPPSSITAIQIPIGQQLPDPKPRARRIPKILSPEEKIEARKSARKFMEKDK